MQDNIPGLHNNLDDGTNSWPQHMNWLLTRVKQKFNAFDNHQLLVARLAVIGNSGCVTWLGDFDDSASFSKLIGLVREITFVTSISIGVLHYNTSGLNGWRGRAYLLITKQGCL